MALMRYVGPLEEARISIAGNDFGTVKPGEALAVPDELAESVGWSEHWESVKDTEDSRAEAKEPVTAPVFPASNEAAVFEPGTAVEDVSDSNTVYAGSNENISDGSENNRDGN